jgi:hypothetical protein
LVSDVFDTHEVTVLQAIQPTPEGETYQQKNPYPLESLAWAAWILAWLGGWKGYGKRQPGPVSMLRGLWAFDRLRQGWDIALLYVSLLSIRENVCIR